MTLPTHLLVATDFSECAEAAEAAAIGWATRLDAALDWVHALEVPLPIFEPYAVAVPEVTISAARTEAQKRLTEAHDRAAKAGIKGTTHLGEVPAAYCIADHAKNVGADLVVVGTHGHRGLRRVLLGSVAEKVVKLSPCSVLTIKGEGKAAAPERILVGVDFSESSAQALATAAELAKSCGASLHLVHAMEPHLVPVTAYDMPLPDGFYEKVHDEAKTRLQALAAEVAGGVETSWSVSEQAPRGALVEVAEEQNADLVVTGSHGRTGIAHALLGSVAERVLRDAPCAVWTVRSH